MKIEVRESENDVAMSAAMLIASSARQAVTARGCFIFAVSGGHTPWLMLRALADHDVPWQHVHLVQVDERVAPDGHADRNLTHLRESLLDHVPLSAEHVYAMPVEADDLRSAAVVHAQSLAAIAGAPLVLDLVHLGIGPDGHTASLVPGDPVCDITNADVAVTAPYQGLRRMTLTFPVLNRAKQVLWVVTGREKIDALAKLERQDSSIPAAHVRQDHAVIIADRVAAGQRANQDQLEMQL